MKFDRKTWPVMGAKALEDDKGIVEAYCSVFNNVDFAGEIVRPGFFAETIQEAATSQKALPPILWSHMAWDQPLGITLEAEEVLPYDSRLPASITSLGGLKVIGQFNMETQSGRDAFSNIKLGALRQYSIGYYVLVDQFDRESGVVELLKGDWLEWSPVNFAANDMTLTRDAKERGGIERTEHLYIVRQPAEFVAGSFKRDVREHQGLKYTVVTGKLRSTGDVEEANIRFDADAWEASDALAFSSSNGKGRFESAGVDTRSTEKGSERLADNGARVVAQMSAYLSRVEEVAGLRLAEGKAGRVLSEANRTILAGLLPDLKSVVDRVQKLLDDTAISTDDGKSGGDDDSTKLSEENAANVRRMLGRMQALEIELTATEV
jgi:HK97 family phage prohead protease